MPVRTFDGVDDKITLALGGTAFAFGPGTVAVIQKRSSDTGAETLVHVGTNTGNTRYALEISTTTVFVRSDGGTGLAPTIRTTVADGWSLLAMTKATGTSVFRLHEYVFGTSTWIHENTTGTAANSTTPTGNAYLGGSPTGNPYGGDIGIAAVWDVVLSDAEIEALVVSQANWSTVAPVALWPLDQAATTTAVQDTVGTADETAITGTSVTADSIPWTASGTTHERSASISATASIATTGTFWTTFERTAAVTATAGIATTGQRALLRSSTVTATGVITTAGQRDLLRAVSVAASGAISTTGTFWTTFERSSTLGASGSISTAGQRDVHRSASLTATGAIATIGQIEGGAVTHERSASLSASAAIASSGVSFHVLSRAAALTATAAVQTTGLRVLLRSVSLSATAGVSAAGRRDLMRSVSLAASGAISTGRQVEAHRSVVLAAVASIAASGTVVGLVVPVGRLEAGATTVTTTEGGFAVSVNESSSGVLALIE